MNLTIAHKTKRKPIPIIASNRKKRLKQIRQLSKENF